MNKIIDRTGNLYTTNQGYEIEIIEYSSRRKCSIKFKDGSILKDRCFKQVSRGEISNPSHRSAFGVGFIGQGEFKPNKHHKIYSCWYGMLRRCYSDRFVKIHTSYKNTNVCESWHSFQNFAKWYLENYNESTMDGWSLDKDFLSDSIKTYSPKTCCFLPIEVNTINLNNISKTDLPLGVYKKHTRFISTISGKYFKTKEDAFNDYAFFKEKHVYEIAAKYKGIINEKAYLKLLNFKVK
jgi:hypothetical protein